MRSRLFLALLAAAAIFLAGSERANAAACTVGTSAVVCAAAKTTLPYRIIVIDNESATATVACTLDGTTPALNTAGSFTFAVSSRFQFGATGVLWPGPVTCIASAAATPVTVEAR